MSYYKNKSSFTGWFKAEHESQRFYNLCKVQKGSLEYFSDWGLDWVVWLDPRISLSAQGMASYITQAATVYGIGISSISSKIDSDHKFKISATINGLTPSATQSTTTYFEV